MDSIVFFLTAILWIAGYAYYFKDTINSSIRPNRWSWLAFSISISLEALTYSDVSSDFWKSGIFFVSSLACVVVTALIWNKARWFRPDWTETFCLVVSVVATVIWLGFGEAWWAHVLLLTAIPVAFIPTYRDAWRNWKNENTPAWILWTLGDALAIIFVLMRLEIWEELPYAIVEFLAHITVWIIVIRGKGGLSQAPTQKANIV